MGGGRLCDASSGRSCAPDDTLGDGRLYSTIPIGAAAPAATAGTPCAASFVSKPSETAAPPTASATEGAFGLVNRLSKPLYGLHQAMVWVAG